MIIALLKGERAADLSRAASPSGVNQPPPSPHGAPSDDMSLDSSSSRREGTGLWGWLWKPLKARRPRGAVFRRFRHSCSE